MKNKRNLLILGIIIVFLISILLLKVYNNETSGLNIYNSKTIKFKYNDGWNSRKENDIIYLENNSKNNITIYEKDNSNDLSIDEITKLLINNYEYTKVIGKEELQNENNYENKSILLENNDQEIMLSVFIKANKIIIIEYVSNINNFDIFLDNVLTINYYLDIKDV